MKTTKWQRNSFIRNGKFTLTPKSNRFICSMGQGQDVIAMSYLETANTNGHWVILNNVHLMPKWLTELEKKLDTYAAEESHEKFRLFLTSDPSNTIPIGILNRCIKLTNEPPSGLKANYEASVVLLSQRIYRRSRFKNKEHFIRTMSFSLHYYGKEIIRSYGF